MVDLKEKWNNLSTRQQIFASAIITVIVLISFPFVAPIVLPLLALAMLLIVPVMVIWCIIKFIMK